MRYFKKLKGTNLYLSPINMEDAEQYTAWVNDMSATIPMGNVSTTYSVEMEKSALQHLVKEGNNFAIVLNESDQLIGNCSLFSISHLHGTAEMGLFIGDEENRGKGYGTESIEVILSYGFKVLNLNNIMLRVFDFNKRGIASYSKVGFEVFGKRTSAYRINGTYFDEIYMEILSENFKSAYLDKELPS